MKSLGLEGKVGAPAIIRTNPLCALLDRHTSLLRRSNPYWPQNLRSSLKDQIGIVFGSSPAPSWCDALETLQRNYDTERDPFMGILQNIYLYEVSTHITDPVLVYDLETPNLGVSIGLERSAPRVVVLRGVCNRLRLDAEVYGIIEGSSDSLCFSAGAILRGGLANQLHPMFDALCVLADTRTTNVPFVKLDHEDALLLSKVQLQYSGVSGAVCDPAEDPRLEDLYDRVRSCSADPEFFLEQMPSLRAMSNELFATAKQLHQRRNDRNEPDSLMIQHFTPRGAS